MPASTETLALAKRIYDTSFGNMIYANRPLLGKLNKVKGGGSVFEQSCVYGESAGASRTDTVAVTNKARSQKAKFLIPFGESYHNAQISSLDQALTANVPKAAFADALATEIDASVQQAANDCELGLIRAKGVRGKISSFATTVITLDNRADTKNFFPGQRLVISATPGSALRNAGAVGTVAGTDEDVGTVRLTVNVATAWAAAANADVIYQEGDAANAGAEKGTLSLEDWLPLTAPTSGDSFAGGVDRSVSVTKLAGVRIDARGFTARETMLRLSSRIGEAEGVPDFALVPFSFWETLALELDSKAQTETMGSGNAAQFGYRALKYIGPNSDIMVAPHARCPGDRIYQLTMKDWTLAIAGGGLDPVQNPIQNGKIRDTGFGMSIEHMAVVYLACRMPGHSGVARIA